MSVAGAVAASPEETPFRRFVLDFAASRLAVLGLIVLTAIALVAIFAPWIAPLNPYDLMQLEIIDGNLPPGSKSADGMIFWLGTDQGRDMLSGIIYGLRISLGVGIGSAVIAGVVGSAIGLTAAYAGGRIEAGIMRLVDLQLSFPSILVALMILAFLGKGVMNVLLALVIVEWARYARPARGTALTELRREFSGGMRQRVAIAIALLHQPDLIIADRRSAAWSPVSPHQPAARCCGRAETARP